MRKKNTGRSFDRVVDNIARTLVKEIEYHPDSYICNCGNHPRFKPMTIGGFKCVHFKDFDELDRELSKEDPEWRTREWAKFWLRDHWAFQTSEYDREDIHTQRGLKFKQRTPGSVRHTRKHKPKAPRIPQLDIANFLQENPDQSLREAELLVRQQFNIKLSYETIRRIKKKYHL